MIKNYLINCDNYQVSHNHSQTDRNTTHTHTKPGSHHRHTHTDNQTHHRYTHTHTHLVFLWYKVVYDEHLQSQLSAQLTDVLQKPFDLPVMLLLQICHLTEKKKDCVKKYRFYFTLKHNNCEGNCCSYTNVY